MTHRRYWVYFLLFLFNVVCYLDRINMSVAGRPVAQESISHQACGKRHCVGDNEQPDRQLFGRNRERRSHRQACRMSFQGRIRLAHGAS